MRLFAEDTTVSVGRSRGEIDDLLRGWGCGAIQWFDDFENGRIELTFRWKREDLVYLARFAVALPSDDQLKKKALDGRSGRFSPIKLDKMRAARGRWEHRVLLLWLKASLNAVEAGIIDPAALFLPFLVGKNGQTVAETALPRLKELLIASADRLLTP